MTKEKTTRPYKKRKKAGHGEHYVRKNRDMYNDFQKLSDRKMNGVPMLSTKAIMSQLVEDYYLTEPTIIQRIKQHARLKAKQDKEEKEQGSPQLRLGMPE